MEKFRYHSGPLHDLQRLEEAEDSNGTSSSKMQQLKKLENEIQSLSSRRHQLKWRLEMAYEKIIHKLLTGDKNENMSDLASSDVYQVSCDAVSNARNQKLQQIHNLYRLTGISIKEIKRNVVRLTFDTFSNGQFFESYYIEVKGYNELSVGNHSLPHFIPVIKIAEQHLADGLRTFAQTVMNMLRAFVCRRQFVKNLQTHLSDYLVNEISSSNSYDFCCLSLTDFPGLEIQMMSSLDKSHPSHIKVIKLHKRSRVISELEQERLSRITKSLLVAQMPEVNLLLQNN
ncbi:centromere protein O-like [Antedon mediterranea]|uniref:centromere protein O-like n=1 Tax=Antedon mediterranea TaxID=105859 RepID=UPI003AF44137